MKKHDEVIMILSSEKNLLTKRQYKIKIVIHLIKHYYCCFNNIIIICYAKLVNTFNKQMKSNIKSLMKTLQHQI